MQFTEKQLNILRELVKHELWHEEDLRENHDPAYDPHYKAELHRLEQILKGE